MRLNAFQNLTYHISTRTKNHNGATKTIALGMDSNRSTLVREVISLIHKVADFSAMGTMGSPFQKIGVGRNSWITNGKNACAIYLSSDAGLKGYIEYQMCTVRNQLRKLDEVMQDSSNRTPPFQTCWGA